MHITELHMYSVPPLERVDIDCDERVNVFLGPNACGKSTILRAIEYIYFSLQQDHPLSFMKFPNSKWPEHWNFEELVGEDNPFCWVITSDDWPQDPEPIDGAKVHQEPNWSEVPLLYMPATRVNLPPEPTDWREENPIGLIEMKSSEPSFARSFGIFLDAEPTVFNAQHVKQVSDVLRLKRLSQPEELDQLDWAMHVGYLCAKSICPEVIRDYAVHPYVDGAGGSHPGMGIGTNDNTGGASLYVGDLSSGTQGTLAWIWALCLKMARHYGWKEGWENEPAILLIDEIENHLHPTWQRRVIPALLKHFPGLQIFATTHSPFVVAGLRAGQVHMLNREADGVVRASTNERDIIGWTTDEILRTFMGVDEPTDQLTVDRSNRLRELRGKDDLTDAESDELAQLRRRVNEDFISSSTPLEEQRERYGDMMLEFLQSRQSELSQDGS